MANIIATDLTITQAPLAKSYWAVNATETDAASNSEVKAAVSGKSLYITKLVINCAVAQTVVLNDASTALLGPYTFLAAGGTSVVINPARPIKLIVSQALNVTAGGAYALYVEGFIA